MYNIYVYLINDLLASQRGYSHIRTMLDAAAGRRQSSESMSPCTGTAGALLHPQQAW
jgi:hypothetical protein